MIFRDPNNKHGGWDCSCFTCDFGRVVFFGSVLFAVILFLNLTHK